MKKIVNCIAVSIVLLLLLPMSAKACGIAANVGQSWKKTYMPYTAITDKNSLQYQLQLNATTDDNGLRTVNGKYCVAIGTAYNAGIGDEISVVLENGNTIPCIVSDIKSDRDTDKTHKYCRQDGSVVEFIVDYNVFNNKKDSSGTVNFIDGFSGSVSEIVVSECDR